MKTTLAGTHKSSVTFYDTFPRKKELTRAQFRLITESFNTALLYDMINTGQNYLLPLQLGILGVLQSKGKYIDYQYYKDTGDVADQRNWHTDGRIAVFKWRKAGTAFFGEPDLKPSFRLRIHRGTKRYFAKRLKSDLSINTYYDANY